MQIPTTRIDIMSDETAADPWPLLRTLREQGPVVWHETNKSWLVTTDREVRAVLADYERFTVVGTTIEELFGADAFFSMDERKKHDDLRHVWAATFRRPALDRLAPTFRAIVDELVTPVAERLQSGEAVDVDRAICRPLPTIIIALMMGVPKEMHADVVRWSDAMAAGGPTTLMADADVAALAAERREAAKSSLADYLLGLLAERRARPGDDLVSALVRADVAAGYADTQLVQNLRQLLFAGNETTARWLAHIFVTLAEHPDVQREVAANRSLVAQTNDEVLRWEGVVGTTMRRVRGGPLELAGIELAEGDDLTCLLGSANRDPKPYFDPEKFDIHRPQQPNLGFGVGLHHCLGINLAKIETEILVNGFFDQVPAFTMSGPYAYTPVPVRGPSPVTIALDGRS